MAVTAKFQADFSSFLQAVDKAELALVDFGKGASQVEGKLNRMVDNFSGRKLIQEATLMEKAIEKAGGLSTLTAKELERVGAKANEAADKMKRLGIEVPAGLQTLADATKGAGQSAQAATGFFADLSGGIVKVAAGFVSAQAVIAAVSGAFRTLKVFIGDSITAFAEAETANVKLVAALRQHSFATPEVIAQYTALGATFQRTTQYSDDQVEAMAALLTQVGGVMPSAMAGALKASADLAAGLGIDLQSATTLVAKAAAGHTETLGRYGITVSAAALESKGFEAVLEAINRQFGGQAAAAVETYAGRLQQAENAWNNVEEAVGKFLVTNPLAVATMRAFNDAATDADTKSAGAAVSVTDLWRAMDLPAPLLIATLETYVEGLNAAAAATERINALPRPFDQIVKDNALPTITAGLKLFTQEVAEHERQTKAAAAVEKQMAAAMIELNSVGGRWHDTLEQIDGEVVEATKFYLAAGVAQSTLATAYGLTAVQVKAVASAMRDEEAAAKSLAAFRAAADARQIEITRQMTAAINDQVIAQLRQNQANEAYLAANLAAALAMDAINFGGAAPDSSVMHSGQRGPVIHGGGAFTSSNLNNLNLGGFQLRDSGGPVTAGQSYLIGMNRQPELFTPGANGFITPLGGGVTVHNTFHIVDTEANLARRLSEHVIRSVKRTIKVGSA